MSRAKKEGKKRRTRKNLVKIIYQRSAISDVNQIPDSVKILNQTT